MSTRKADTGADDNNNHSSSMRTFDMPLQRTTLYCYYYMRLTASFPGKQGKTSLDLNEVEMMGFGEGSGISWTICKQSAPRSRQTTTPTPYHSIFNRLDALPDA